MKEPDALLHRAQQAHLVARVRVRRWALGALVLALLGCGLAAFGARQAAHADAARSRELFRLAATQVEANMNLEVQRETDLLIAATAHLREHPGYDPAGFKRWVANVRAVARYPELIALALMQPGPGGSDRCPRIVFAGPARIARFAALGARAVCASPQGLLQTRDGGRLVDFGFRLLNLRFFGETLPVYSTVTVPATVAARRRRFIGWVAIGVRPSVLLGWSSRGYPDLNLQLHTTDEAHLTFGHGPKLHGMSVTTSLGDGLTETVTGHVQGSSIADDGPAMLILLGGCAVSALLALALFLLGTGRARAMRAVTEKTGELAHQALHDTLTGLPNRVLLMDRVDHALARTTRGAPPIAVLYIDLDGFKTINDTFGHAAGDQLLRTVGARLAEMVRGADTVGRLGGDEFVVLLEPETAEPEPELVAQRILETISRPIDIGEGVQVRLTASVGVAVGRHEDTADLLRDADLALYSAKHGGRNRHVTFEGSMQSAIAERHALEVDLKRALGDAQLFLVYQPTFALADRHVGGVEALLRWRHPTRGLVAPDTFIPIAEESGLILEIGRWVTREACAQAAAWRGRELELTMSVNISGRQLDEPGFTGEIRRTLEETGLEASALTLEITETALMRDPKAAAARLRELKALGVRIAIDDFGTGYSSLAYLREFPVDSLKIDRVFISELGGSQDASAFVSTLVALGRNLRLETLAEGIEHESQLERLRETRCDLGQGYLLAPPLPADELEALLDAHRHRLPIVAG